MCDLTPEPSASPAALFASMLREIALSRSGLQVRIGLSRPIAAGLSMATINHEHCPTCAGTTFITRGASRIACPTCSPRTQQIGLHVAYLDGGRRAARVWRLLLWGVVIALIVLVLASPGFLF